VSFAKKNSTRPLYLQVRDYLAQQIARAIDYGGQIRFDAARTNGVPRRLLDSAKMRALGWRPKSPGEVDATLVGLVDRVTRRMRSAGRIGRTVVLRLRFDDSTRATRSHTLLRPTAQTETILNAARALLAGAEPLITAQGITLVGITVANLDNDGALQLPLPFDAASALDVALDEVRKRYGSAAVTRAVLLGRDPGLTVPMLPD